MAPSTKKLMIALVVIIIALIPILIFAKKKGLIGNEDLLKVSVEEASRRTITQVVSASGNVHPVVEVKLSPDVSGEVVELLIEEGDSVKAGMLLAQIEPDIYNSMVERAEASMNASKANEMNAKARTTQAKERVNSLNSREKQVEAQLKNVEATYQRNLQLFKDGVISQADLDQAELGLTNAQQEKASLAAEKAQLQAEIEASEQSALGAEYNVKSARANLKEAKDNLKKTNIYAPVDGVVSMLSIEKGERVVGTSQFQGTEIMRIADFSKMEVRVDVSENDVLKVKKGDNASIEVDAYSDRKFNGIVTKVSNSAVTESISVSDQVINFTVKILLDAESYADLAENSSMPFRPGMSATAEIATKTLDNVLAIPIQSVTTRTKKDSLETDDDEEPMEVVFVANEGTVEQKAIEIGIQDDSHIEVINGLEQGDQVINAPYRAISKTLKDGRKVEIVEKKELFKKKSGK